MDQILEGKIKVTICGIRRINYPINELKIDLDIVCAIGKRFAPKFILTPEVKELYIKLI